jgi:hypothetical protein
VAGLAGFPDDNTGRKEMVKLRRWILLGAFLLVPVLTLAACGGGGNGGDDEASPNGAASPNRAASPNGATANDEVVVQLAEVDGSGESGSATLTAMGDQTRVVLAMRNTTTDSQPAHIHEGSCGPALNPAPLHGLLNVMQGRSETVVNRPLSELTAGGLAINVHQSAAELETYVACGNLPGWGDDMGSSDGGFGY